MGFNDDQPTIAGLGKTKKTKVARAEVAARARMQRALYTPPSGPGVRMADLDRAAMIARRRTNAVFAAAQTGRRMGIDVRTRRQLQARRRVRNTAPGAPWITAPGSPVYQPPGGIRYGPLGRPVPAAMLPPSADAYPEAMSPVATLPVPPPIAKYDGWNMDGPQVDDAPPNNDDAGGWNTETTFDGGASGGSKDDAGDDAGGEEGGWNTPDYGWDDEGGVNGLRGVGFLKKFAKLIKRNKNTIGRVVAGVATAQNPLLIATGAIAGGGGGKKAKRGAAQYLPAPPQTSPNPNTMPAWAIPAAIVGAALLLQRR